MKRAALMLILLALAVQGLSQNADINLLKHINLGRSQTADQACLFISNSVSPLTIAAPIGFIAYALIRKDSASKSKAIIVTGALLISGVITPGTKYIIHRPRPFETYPYIEKKASGRGYSFPSGHTSTAFALATSLSISYPKWYVIAPSYVWASAVGYSRMELGVHYPSDVLAGAIVGIGSTFLSYQMNQWINKRNRRLKQR